MESVTHVEVTCSGINLVAPEGYMSVQLSVQFTIGNDPRYTVASLDIPVPMGEETTVSDARNTALGLAKSYLCPQIVAHMPSSFDA